METDSVEYIVEFNRLNIVPFEYTTELELYSGYGIPPFDEDEYNNFKKEIDCADRFSTYCDAIDKLTGDEIKEIDDESVESKESKIKEILRGYTND